MTAAQTAASAKSVARNPIPRGLWWIAPALVVLVLGGFTIYSFWSIVIASSGYTFGPYLSPFYSPLLAGVWPLSPALLIFWVPLGFRATCYYYRKAYYRSFFLDPPACAIGERKIPTYRPAYKGERTFPFVLLNLHRFFLYLALLFVFFLGIDAARGFVFDGKFGVGFGSLLIATNVVLLALYTFSCHSLRHLVGGGTDCFSCSAARYSLWQRISTLNSEHALYAWLSLFSVVASDLYVRLLSAGVVTDLRLF